MEIDSRHQCLIYSGSPSQQLPSLASMIKRKLNEGHRCLYLNSPAMVAGMRSSLATIGIDVVNELARARLVLSSAFVTSQKGGFDVDLMIQQLEDALNQALDDGYHGLWATGDMTWEFGSEKNHVKFMEYEYRLEKLFRKRKELCGICQYHTDTLPHEAVQQSLLTHGMIFINETLSRINTHYLPSGPSNAHLATSTELDEAITALCHLQNKKSE